MRRRSRSLRLVSLGLAVSLAASAGAALTGGTAHAQDFDPHGRHRPGGGNNRPAPRPNPSPSPAPRPNPGSNNGGNARPQPNAPAPSPDDATKGPNANVLIERYTRIVLAQPGSPFPLQRLAQLYRERDGNIAKLVTDFETRAAQTGGDAYAATVTLAGLYKIDGRADDAIKTYEKAIAQKADDATAILALARLLQDRGDTAAARKRYEQALALQKVQADREQTLRTLMTLALDSKDWAAAKKWHTEIVKLQPNSLFVKGELGRELFNRAEYERAEAEFKDLVAAAAGDNRALAPALKELGRAQAKAHKNVEAVATLKRALATAGQEAAVRAEIYEIITEIYRADQQLPVLVKQLEDEHPNDFARLALLGGLYEETGDTQKAITTYKRALALNPRHIDIRLRMVRLLQANGELDRAISEYEELIKAAPNNPTFVFEQCEALMQRGDRTRALKLLTDLEARAQTDEEILARVADFYQRIGENEKALKVLQRLAQVSTSDPGHLVDLGDHYFQTGNTALAVQTWKRILVMIQPRAKAEAALGDVYLEHDMTVDALASFKNAVQLDPANLGYRKQLAGAFERLKNYREARALYQEIAEKAKATGDRTLARECRSHMVTLWGLERVLEQQVAPLTQSFNKKPPDVEAGRTLAEVYLHLRKLPDTETTLRKVIELAPGDAESYLALERVLVQENKIAEAIAVLEKLVQVEPKRARELYQRMASYALQIYKDDDAIKYAARAVELNPDDAEGHRRLGEMYRSRQDTEHAIVEFRAAITKNDRLYIVYFELADLLLSKGQPDEADRLFRRVIRGAPDEELVARAARLSMQINLGKGTLESLEQDLLPMAIGNPQRPVYRHLLVEIYGNLTFALVQRVRHGSARTGGSDGVSDEAKKDADDARAALARIGARAIKPLLDALADQDVGQQRIAIDVLGYVQNKNAALPLFSYATGSAEAPLRARAMIASGALRDEALVPKYEALLFPKEAGGDDAASTDAVAVAATWGLARIGSKALPVLRRLAKSGSAQMRALAVLGLGAAHDKTAAVEIAQLARAPDSGNVARAAAAYALGDLDAEAEAPTLLALAQGSEALPREAAIVALARMGAGKGEPPGGKAALNAMADALFSGGDADSPRARAAQEGLERAAVFAFVTLTTGPANNAGDALPVPDGNVDVEAMIDALVPRTVPEAARAAALVKYGDAVQRAALGALQTSGDRARAVLDALGDGDGTLEPFVSKDGGAGNEAARARARDIVKSLEPNIVPLVRHPDVPIRAKALAILARGTTDAAASALVVGVLDPSEAVQRVALAAIGRRATPEAVAAVAKLLAGQDAPEEKWAVRVLAAQAMGRLGAAGAGAEAKRTLTLAAQKDGYALVRQAALEALAAFDIASAKALAMKMAAADPEPRVREAAEAIARR